MSDYPVNSIYVSEKTRFNMIEIVHFAFLLFDRLWKWAEDWFTKQRVSIDFGF